YDFNEVQNVAFGGGSIHHFNVNNFFIVNTEILLEVLEEIKMQDFKVETFDENFVDI
ncbi:hypothetical protein BgiBS90_019043, partial [Biomphalaria glabrata]